MATQLPTLQALAMRIHIDDAPGSIHYELTQGTPGGNGRLSGRARLGDQRDSYAKRTTRFQKTGAPRSFERRTPGEIVPK
jgi:hypothetical protein